MSNSVGMLPVDIDLLLQLVHGPVRELLNVILMPPETADVWSSKKKLSGICNRVMWLYTEPINHGAYGIPHHFAVTRPIVLWCWSLEQTPNETCVCIKLLDRLDCLNDPEREFYRHIAIDLLQAHDEKQLRIIHDRLSAVAGPFGMAANDAPNWSKGYRHD